MPKSALERQIEKQMKQDKQLAERNRRDTQRRDREQRAAANAAALRERASSIVNGQPLVAGFRIMDETAELVLKCLLDNYGDESGEFCYSDDIFPENIQYSMPIELEKLLQYGMIGVILLVDNGGILVLLPPAHKYFKEKEKALARKEAEEKIMGNTYNNYGNMIWGNVSDSTLNVNNSISALEQAIEEKGGEDKEMLRDLLGEVKELVENIETTGVVPKQRKLFQRLSDHVAKHGWFYGAVVQTIGTAVMNRLGA